MLEKKNKLLLDDFKSNDSKLSSDEINELKYIVNNLIYIQIDLETVAFSEKTIVFKYENIEKENNAEFTTDSVTERYVKLEKTDKVNSYKKIMDMIDELIKQTSVKYKINKLLKIKNILLNIMYHEDLIQITEINNSNFRNHILQNKIMEINDVIDYLKYILDTKAEKIFNSNQIIREFIDIESTLTHRKHEILINDILYFKRELAPTKHLKNLDEILDILDKILINHHDKAV